ATTGEAVEFHGVTVTGQLGEAPSVAVLPGFTAPTNLLYTDLVVGEGQPVVDHAEVKMRYLGVVAATAEVFDSTFAGADPALVSIDDQIAGLTDGLLGMQAGGRRLLIVPADLGYGPSGLTGKVGADEALVFVVDMLSVNA
ncbi:MAG: FKBP-type peptidyl-prolyl cis-trans isomerase, partial [Candidatus Nanopelagicales bacterium]